MHAACFATGVITYLLLSAMQPFFAARLAAESPERFASLGRPGSLYFLSGRFFAFGRFARWLLAFGALRAAELSENTRRWATVEGLLFVTMLTAWAAGLLNLLSQRL